MHPDHQGPDHEGPDLHLRYGSWMGIEPAASPLWDDASTNLATLAKDTLFLKIYLVQLLCENCYQDFLKLLWFSKFNTKDFILKSNIQFL